MTDWVPDDIFQTALGRIGPAGKRCPTWCSIWPATKSSYSTGSEFIVDGGNTAGLAHKDFSTMETAEQPEWVT